MLPVALWIIMTKGPCHDAFRWLTLAQRARQPKAATKKLSRGPPRHLPRQLPTLLSSPTPQARAEYVTALLPSTARPNHPCRHRADPDQLNAPSTSYIDDPHNPVLIKQLAAPQIHAACDVQGIRSAPAASFIRCTWHMAFSLQPSMIKLA